MAEERTSSWVMHSGEPAAISDLLVDEVDAGDHFGDRMLDLDAGVHFDEIERAVLVEEFDRPDAVIIEFAHGGGEISPISRAAHR